MPFVLFIAYILLETLAFWAVANWIGVLWALLALGLTMLFGMTIASWEVRRMMSARIRQTGDGMYVMEDPTPGKTAGNVGLTMVGGMLLSAPGFVSTILGALLIFAPTRSIIRTLLAASMFKKIENLGVRVYEASPMAQHRDSYGSFGSMGPSGTTDPNNLNHEVIDEDELREWTQHVKPEDFGDGKK
ncbi:FxsA family protein [Corynebacterium minutissimum]|uniref:FxsA n=1 Tax=Corynebacterium minutissimum TaxID=38301 RepID=A0A2X4R9C7_9CORY|nr:FxsA family protein [Corynebacterium minutissimum]KHO29497.1 exlusion protein FxsA [Corynebacterium minutissimum]QPS58911.1 FxsA family protein [Corynebacterium minutissimum]QQA80299.1 FxsA family protein [Corynebacterium minutissimum]SQH99947.1 FxsA [Corynebacterium minutissimum]VEG05986.1 FxsA [Corynebacterium minutissimum]